MMSKRGQAAAVLLAIIMGLIIFFIILIPPEKRADILGESPSAAPADQEPAERQVKEVQEVLLQETPGRLSYLKDSEIEKLIPATHIFTQSQSSLLAERSYFTIKKGAFSSQTEEVYFQLTDVENTEEVLLDFVVESFEGELIILLNGQEIFNRATNKISPITLPKNLLATDNTLLFKVSSPGIAFWKTNQYDLKNLKVAVQVTDVSARQSRHLIYVSPDETRNIQKVTLRYSLSCDPNQMGRLDVKLNNQVVFSGVPENCEDLFYYDLPPEIIRAGDNWLSFETDQGDYDLSHIAVKIDLETPSYPVYYFDLDDDYFTTVSKEDARCGEADGVCPDSCDEDADQDCCYREYSPAYWCDAPTSNSGDRCVGHVDQNDCARCPSGYEDEDNDPAEECAGYCGDDSDNYCPPNCNSDYDQDCCFELGGDQFWCAALPTNGIDFTCVDDVGTDECRVCTVDYEGENNNPDCPADTATEEDQLKKTYDVILTLEFSDDEQKEAEIYVNGHKISFDTYKVEFSRNIDNHLEPWTNSIKIVPKTSFDVRQLSVELKS